MRSATCARTFSVRLELGGMRSANPGAIEAMAPALAGGGASAAVTERLAAHLARLAAAPIPAQRTDPAVIEAARRHIAGASLARVGYDLVLARPAVSGLAPWRPSEHIPSGRAR